MNEKILVLTATYNTYIDYGMVNNLDSTTFLLGLYTNREEAKNKELEYKAIVNSIKDVKQVIDYYNKNLRSSYAFDSEDCKSLDSDDAIKLFEFFDVKDFSELEDGDSSLTDLFYDKAYDVLGFSVEPHESCAEWWIVFDLNDFSIGDTIEPYCLTNI